MEPVQGESAASPTARETSPPLAELADRMTKRISTALIIAGALVGVAIYARPAPNRFEAFVANGEVFRVNTKTGTVIACNATRCMTVVQRGKRLVGFKEGRLFQRQPAAAPAALPPAAPPPGEPTTAAR